MGRLDTIALAAGTVVIGDLHLDVDDPSATAAFARWLAALEDCPRVIVLGDLFEFWVGPVQAESPSARELLASIARRVAAGTRFDVIPGNRDFLLDETFEERTGARLRRPGVVGETERGERVLFLHGDELSTEDHGYQRMRRILRSAPVRWLAPRLPRRLAFAIARRLRRASRSAIRQKPAARMAQQPDAVRREAEREAAQALVCGHAHVYRDERREAEREAAQALVCGHAHVYRDDAVPEGPRWMVLDAFGGKRDTLLVAPELASFDVVGSRDLPGSRAAERESGS